MAMYHLNFVKYATFYVALITTKIYANYLFDNLALKIKL